MTRCLARLVSGSLLAGLFASSAAAGDEGSAIRVLVLEAAGPVRITDENGRASTISVASGGLLEDGRPVAAPFALDGRGPQGVDERRYRGRIEVMPTEHGLAVVNEVGLEDYVAGCVAGEIPSSWQPEAQRTQAVVSRTYALHASEHRGDRPWDLAASTAGQVYGGADAETPASREAAHDTRGEYLAFDGGATAGGLPRRGGRPDRRRGRGLEPSRAVSAEPAGGRRGRLSGHVLACCGVAR